MIGTHSTRLETPHCSISSRLEIVKQVKKNDLNFESFHLVIQDTSKAKSHQSLLRKRQISMILNEWLERRRYLSRDHAFEAFVCVFNAFQMPEYVRWQYCEVKCGSRFTKPQSIVCQNSSFIAIKVFICGVEWDLILMPIFFKCKIIKMK